MDICLESFDLFIVDLVIDNLFLCLQIIYMVINIYICKGGSLNFENLEIIFYSIDLNMGELLYDVVFNGFGVMLKLCGEQQFSKNKKWLNEG